MNELSISIVYSASMAALVASMALLLANAATDARKSIFIDDDKNRLQEKAWWLDVTWSIKSAITLTMVIGFIIVPASILISTVNTKQVTIEEAYDPVWTVGFIGIILFFKVHYAMKLESGYWRLNAFTFLAVAAAFLVLSDMVVELYSHHVVTGSSFVITIATTGLALYVGGMIFILANRLSRALNTKLVTYAKQQVKKEGRLDKVKLLDDGNPLYSALGFHYGVSLVGLKDQILDIAKKAKRVQRYTKRQMERGFLLSLAIIFTIMVGGHYALGMAKGVSHLTMVALGAYILLLIFIFYATTKTLSLWKSYVFDNDLSILAMVFNVIAESNRGNDPKVIEAMEKAGVLDLFNSCLAEKERSTPNPKFASAAYSEVSGFSDTDYVYQYLLHDLYPSGYGGWYWPDDNSFRVDI